MSRFNVTLIQPPGYAHSLALGEVWIYLADALRRCGHEANTSKNLIVDGEHNIILCGHLLPKETAIDLPRTSIIFNSEKLEDTDGWHFDNRIYSDLLGRHFVWDYSSRNISLITHARTAQIPLYYSPALRRNFPRCTNGSVLFYGVKTERRLALLKALDAAGVPLAIVPLGCYGSERDRHVLGAKAVLNLHTNDALTIFEPVRCFLPLSNGIPVITEDFLDEPMFDLFRKSTFVVRDIVGDTMRLLADPDQFDAQSRHHARTFADSDPLPLIEEAVGAYFNTLG